MAAAMVAACQVEKSANPLSPAVGGPIEGVVISTPNILEPGQDWQLRAPDQPLKMLFQNASTSGVRPLKYSFDIATDADFKNIVFARTGLEPDSGGVTRFQLPDKLAAGTYWWRTRAEDGANSGPYAAPKSFTVLADVVLGPPALSSPANGSTVSDLTPEFKIKAGNRSGVRTELEYTVQISNNSSFSSIAATFIQKETWPETRIDQGYSFLYGKLYYWRARAVHNSDGIDQSNWSSVQTFRTPAAPAPAPGPEPGGPAPPPSGNGDWTACGSTPGKAIVECVRNAVYRQSTLENAFDITKRVAWLLRGKGYGLLLKPGGENIITWRGKSLSISRIMLPNGNLAKVLSDAGPGGSNAASWQQCFDKNDLECFVESDRYVPAIDPSLP